jgi:hypothetical protein
VLDSRTLRSSPESGTRVGYDGAKRKKGTKLHMSVDTLGHLLAAHVTPATADDRAEVGQLAQARQGPPARASIWPMSIRAIGARGRRMRPGSMGSHWRWSNCLRPTRFLAAAVLWIVERTFAWGPRFVA